MPRKKWSTAGTRRTEIIVDAGVLADVEIIAIRARTCWSEVVQELLRHGLEWTEAERERSGSGYAAILGLKGVAA